MSEDEKREETVNSTTIDTNNESFLPEMKSEEVLLKTPKIPKAPVKRMKKMTEKENSTPEKIEVIPSKETVSSEKINTIQNEQVTTSENTTDKQNGNDVSASNIDSKDVDKKDFKKNKNWKKNNKNRNNHRNNRKKDEDMIMENVEPGMNIQELQQKSMQELSEMALTFNVEGVGALCKHDLVFAILKTRAEEKGILYGGGVLEVLSDGFGFLRSPEYCYMPSPEDIYLSPSQIKRFSLRTGDTICGQIRPPRDKERFFAMLKVEAINDGNPSVNKSKIPFENLTADFPDTRLIMETTSDDMSMRIVDLVSPIGAGQRGVIVAPPRTGKTVLLQQIANSIAINHPDFVLIVLLIDERPEEVTDMKRNVKGEVISSTFDEPQSRHIQVAEMVIEKAKRLVEHGRNVIILLDSLTRLARAYNTVQPHSGKILSGGVDANALHKPRRFFAAARNLQEGGSLTILATALVDTGSKMDEVIFEEFKGTGNMELQLDRTLAEKRIYPAINIEKSGTRKEDLIMHPDELARVWKLRRAMGGAPAHESMQLLLQGLKKHKTNAEFLMGLQV